MANQMIGSVTTDITRSANAAGESALGDVIADAQLAATSSATTGNAVVAMTNPGGIRIDMLYAQISGGEQLGQITYGEAFAVQPFYNILYTRTYTGTQIKDDPRAAGHDSQDAADLGQPDLRLVHGRGPGSKVSNLKINGVAVDPTASYRVTMNNFIATGGDGFTDFTAGTDTLVGMSRPRRPGRVLRGQLTGRARTAGPRHRSSRSATLPRIAREPAPVGWLPAHFEWAGTARPHACPCARTPATRDPRSGRAHHDMESRPGRRAHRGRLRHGRAAGDRVDRRRATGAGGGRLARRRHQPGLRRRRQQRRHAQERLHRALSTGARRPVDCHGLVRAVRARRPARATSVGKTDRCLPARSSQGSITSCRGRGRAADASLCRHPTQPARSHMRATAGKVALVNNSTTLTGTVPRSARPSTSSASATANCYEGSGPAADHVEHDRRASERRRHRHRQQRRRLHDRRDQPAQHLVPLRRDESGHTEHAVAGDATGSERRVTPGTSDQHRSRGDLRPDRDRRVGQPDVLRRRNRTAT